MLKLYSSGSSVVFETGFGLLLRYDWLHRLEVRLSPELSTTACGLCGGSGRNASHNLPALGGNGTVADRAAAVVAFARSWKMVGDSSLCRDDCSSCPSCDLAQLNVTPGVQACSLLNNPKGPFANCLKTVDSAPYVQACKVDLCIQKGGHEIACRVFKAFADYCQGSGIQISPWRELANCCKYVPVYKLLCKQPSVGCSTKVLIHLTLSSSDFREPS